MADDTAQENTDIMADETAANTAVHIDSLPSALSIDEIALFGKSFRKMHEIAQRRPNGNLSSIDPDVIEIVLQWMHVLCLSDREVWKKAASVSPEQAPRVSVAKKPRSVQRLSNAARPKARRLFALVPDE